MSTQPEWEYLRASVWLQAPPLKARFEDVVLFVSPFFCTLIHIRFVLLAMEVSTMPHTLLHVNPSAEVIRVGALTVNFLISGEDSGGTVAIFELFVPSGERLPVPAHSHDHYEETIYGVEGVLSLTVDGRQIEVEPGEALCIPRGAVHRFDNNGAQNVKALCLITPAALAPQYFRDCAAVINAGAGRPPDRLKLTEIMRRHGLTPA